MDTTNSDPTLSEAKSGTDNLGPSIDVSASPEESLLELEMSVEEAKEWWSRIEASDKRIEDEAKSWDILLKAYIPSVKAAGTPEDVNTNSHFRNTHTKLGQMFVMTPEVRMEPDSPGPGDNTVMGPAGLPVEMKDVIAIKQSYLNKKLGRDGINVKRLFGELGFDILQYSGIGCSKLGYRSVSQQVAKPVMQPQPNWMPPQQMGGVLGLGPTPQAPQVPVMDPATGQPQTTMQPVIVFEEIYWRKFSPKKLVTDGQLYSTRFDEDASFMGMRFAMVPGQAAQTFHLTADQLTPGKDDKRFKHKNEGEGNSVITGVEIFAKAAFYVEGEVHPKKLVQIVFLDHMREAPVVYRFYKDQSFNPEGQLTDDSIDRFPIRVTTIRDLTDSQFPPPDSAFTHNLVKQLNTSRQQGVTLRDAAIGRILYDFEALEEGDVNKIKRSKPGDWIAVGSGKLEKGIGSIAAPLQQATRTSDDYRLDSMLQQNMDETLGISANSAGAQMDTVRSASEVQAVAQAVAGRNETEQGRMIDSFLDGVRLIDILIMRYTTETQWAKVTGETGQAVMAQWNGSMVSGRWLYDIAPDSQLRVDTAMDRQQNLTFYNLVAKDPLVNRAPILQRLARQFGYDPSKIIVNPMQMQMPHGGEVNKHSASNSGGMENAPGAENLRNAQEG